MDTESTNSKSVHMKVASQAKLAGFDHREERKTDEQSLAANDSAVGCTENPTESEVNNCKNTRHPSQSLFNRICGNSTEDSRKKPLEKSDVENSQRTDTDSEVTSESQNESLIQSKSKYGPHKYGVDNSTMISDDDMKKDGIDLHPPTSSKPFLDMIPVTSSTEPQESVSNVLYDSKCWNCFQECFYGIENFCGNNRCLQKFFDLFKLHVTFLLAFLVCLMLGYILDHKDGPYCAMATIGWCFLITLTFERGCFTQWLERKAVENVFPDEEDGNLVSASSCHGCWCSNESNEVEPIVQRHSRYARPRNAENTTFFCEVSDVSEMDSDEFPKMRTVVQDQEEEYEYDSSSSSGNFSGRSRLVKAIVHQPDLNITENNISTCENSCQGACACPSQSNL